MENYFLGLDLGVSSIGWAVVSESDSQSSIAALGCRVVPLSTNDETEFTKGQAITKNADRTRMRSQRKGYDRFQLRRRYLADQLAKMGMSYGPQLSGLDAKTLWGLRAKAVSEQISLQELGRVLFHLNQKRGYRSAKGDYGDKKQSEYVKAVYSRYDSLKERNLTIGQFFYEKLCDDESFRCKDQVFPRAAYVAEFDAIIARQRLCYPAVLTDENIDILRNRIIYYQRPLKSCKHLVSVCEFEKRAYRSSGGKVVFSGPKVAPRSSPLFQVCKIWESINNLCLRNKVGDVLYITAEQKWALFEFMNTHEKLKLQDLYKLLGIKKTDGWWGGKAIGAGLQGNTTYTAIAKALEGYADAEKLLQFDLQEIEGDRVCEESGEISRVIAPDFEKQPLYNLWHVLYSISDQQELELVLRNKFEITDAGVIDKLCKIDFVKSGYGNKSSRMIRKILPYLRQGEMYSNACAMAGFRHSDSLTKEEMQSRELVDRLPLFEKGALRQPIVEKILNQMINVVNALMERYGRFSEIRVELARELKQSSEERNKTVKAMAQNRKENERIAQCITDEYGLTATRSRIQKMKLWEEAAHRCLYCGQLVNVKDFLRGFDVEVEHIIPRSLLFDDSFSNKVCSCRTCNQEKNNRTAYDYMKSKGEGAFQAYIERVNDYYKERRIGKAKFEKLLMPQTEIPTDFIDRQLRESQYVAKKAKELLQQVCRNVHSTSGSVTDFIRHTWGWDRVLHDLNFAWYKSVGLTEMREIDTGNMKVVEERIKGWNKRMDHRHHAVDALVIACTKQGYIQRINRLNTLKEEPFARIEKQSEAYKERHSLLERYILAQPHFSTREVSDAVSRILISFKAGKRVAVYGKRYIRKAGKRLVVQDRIIVPRGALCEQSIYGSINRYEKNKKGAVHLDRAYVLKYPLSSIDTKSLKDVVDGGIRRILQERLDAFGGTVSKAYAEPVLDHNGKPIRSVRCLTGLSAVVPAKESFRGDAAGFVKPGNNHHVAIYCDREGKLYEHIVSFWHAVDRKRFGLPVVIEHPEAVWDRVTEEMNDAFLNQLPDVTWRLTLSMQQNEMFVLGLPEEEYRYALDHGDFVYLSKFLYRVQKLSAHDYFFRLHTETTVDDKYDGVKNASLSKQMGKLRQVRSLGALLALNPHKVRVSLLGVIEEL